MTHGGFLDQRTQSPTSLAFVGALHVAAIGALILFPPTFLVPDRIPSFPLINIEDPPPPPQIPDDPPPPAPKQREAVTKPVVVVPTLPKTPTGPTFPPNPLPPIPGPTAGTDPIPPLPLPPVEREAVIDQRAPFQPSYPPRLARQEIAGNTVVRVLIGSDGRVKAVEMLSATDPEFFEATRKQALRFWRFKPATRDGVPVESWRTLTVRFEMKA
ncbi:outer membrane transport energization protein TonB [Sphingomonas laterariae]|uniref:Protein TonB n=1 Tax=Edaphosphingomonas laterariae TaxID=861865 RepID=A0A239FJQ8_9SPHN|nr:energy transducer TonB [Sphingomonas laterariae]SNS56991.1 outer membrane transport energization protein TonB [Sphingomonas laterariae]